jgi:hypothetical protein
MTTLVANSLCVRLAFTGVLCMLAFVALSAENWPQWRGPQLNGVSREINLPIAWDKSTNVTWKLALPSWSGATPIVWNEVIFSGLWIATRDP